MPGEWRLDFDSPCSLCSSMDDGRRVVKSRNSRRHFGLILGRVSQTSIAASQLCDVAGLHVARLMLHGAMMPNAGLGLDSDQTRESGMGVKCLFLRR